MTSAELKKQRAKRGWSQQYLADALGVDVRTVRRWEAGDRGISAPMAQLIKLTFDRTESDN